MDNSGHDKVQHLPCAYYGWYHDCHEPADTTESGRKTGTWYPVFSSYSSLSQKNGNVSTSGECFYKWGN